MKALQFIFNRLGKKTAQDKKTVCSWYNDSTIVLTQGLSASFDYYIAPQLVSMGSTDFTLLDTRLQAPPLNNVPGNASGQIVISRYLPPHWTMTCMTQTLWLNSLKLIVRKFTIKHSTKDRSLKMCALSFGYPAPI